MTIEELRDWLEQEMKALANSARAENQPFAENHLIGQRTGLQRVVNKIDESYSNEEEEG